MVLESTYGLRRSSGPRGQRDWVGGACSSEARRSWGGRGGLVGRDEALGREERSSSDSLESSGAPEVVPDGQARRYPLNPQSADSH